MLLLASFLVSQCSARAASAQCLAAWRSVWTLRILRRNSALLTYVLLAFKNEPFKQQHFWPLSGLYVNLMVILANYNVVRVISAKPNLSL